jgi:quinoprotein glucose dehydrogenase
MRRFAFLCACAISLMGVAASGQETPGTSAASIPDATKAIRGFTLAEGITATLYAAEPDVKNPVAFCFDETGKLYVCETYRQEKGVEDNRDHAEWVDDDLAAQTVEDRLAYYKKHLGADLAKYSDAEDRIMVLQDTDGDHRADRSNVFAKGFNGPLDGTGAGILARKGNIYYTCIPNFWAFRDDNDDDQADRELKLAEGFGVRTAFRGHDLHGLTLGLDGRIYFSIGDRGYHVETKDGVLANAETGAVFRCEQDGTRLEVFATGFRNPQELAFDDFGNLFTGDNNSDSGDLARWVHVLEGGDSGWRMAYQYLPDRGPWNQEKLWEPHHPGQPAYIVPPVANIADGPSGIAYYPGTGLSDAYLGNFFLCDFRGQTGQSGVRTFKVRPKGATFELVEPEVFLWNCLVTDIAFGPDGAVYVSDWVDGWEGTGHGRIYRLVDEKQQLRPEVAEVQKLIATPKEDVAPVELAKQLEHADQRVRLAAQMELALRRETDTLLQVANKSNFQLARLHAVQGLGQVARVSRKHQEFMKEATKMLHDVDPVIRATTALIVGEAGYIEARDQLLQLLNDDSPGVKYAAAMAIGRLKIEGAAPSLARMLARESKEVDPALRHAVVMGLVGTATSEELQELGKNSNPNLRMASLLAMRRLGDSSISEFLQDSDSRIVDEAARAIYDVPVADALPALAKKITAASDSFPLLRRVLAANYRLGGAPHAKALAEYAANEVHPAAMRIEAMEMLANWETPSARDRVLGMWRPIEPRSRKPVEDAIRSNLEPLVRSGLEIRLRAVQQAAALGIEEAGPLLKELLEDKTATPEVRAGVLLAMGTFNPKDLDNVIQQKLKDTEPRLRAAARILLTQRHPEAALPELKKGLTEGDPLERKAAMTLIANLGTEESDAVVVEALRGLIADKVPGYLKLEVLMAGRRRQQTEAIAKLVTTYDAAKSKDDPLAPYRETLEGGNAERGRQLFTQRLSLSCVRCHKVNGTGGEVGPDLTKVAAEKSREYLLESLVVPNKQIAKGFETVILGLNDGSTVTGIVQAENAKSITLVDDQARTFTVDVDRVEERTQGPSSMPADLLRFMTIFDLRDMVEYLSTLK